MAESLDDALQDVVDRYVRLDYAGTIAAADPILQQAPVPFVAYLALTSLQRLGWKEQADDFAAEARLVFADLDWESKLLRLVEGTLHPGEVLEHAEEPEQVAQAHFYAGTRALTLGEEAAARAWFTTATKIGIDGVEPRLAATELDVLERYQGLAGRYRIFLRRALAAMDADDAVALQQSLDAAVQLRETVFGEYHPLNGPLSFVFAKALQRTGDSEGAKDTIWAGIETLRRGMGHASYVYGLALDLAESFFRGHGDEEQAQEAHDTKGPFEVGGENGLDPLVVATAGFAYERGDLPEAADMTALAFRMRDEAPAPALETEVHLELARYLTAEDEWKRATQHLKAALKATDADPEADPAERADLLMELIVALRKLGHNVEATTTLQRLRSETGMDAEEPDDNASGFLFALADRHAEAGLHAAALGYYEECLSTAEKAYGTDDTELVGVLAELGRMRMIVGRFDGARSAFERALDVAMARHLDRHPQWSETLERVRELLEELDEVEAAVGDNAATV